MNKIALGTAQFGMDYGINNKRGKIPKEEAFKVLMEALEHRIDTLDTAYSYGESESVIGEFTRENKQYFKIVSKLPKCRNWEIEGTVNSSLDKLNIDTFYGYLIHDFKHFSNNREIWDTLDKLKSGGKIKKIGFSIYSPYELKYILENKIKLDLIQIPFSILDRRFEEYLPELKKQNIEVHCRSVFLQGLVFKKPDELTNNFTKIKDKIENLHLLSKEINIPLSMLCLNFVVLNKFIDKVIVGVDSIGNFDEILHSLGYLSDVEKIFDKLSLFKEDDENILLPMNWEFNKVINQ